MSATLLFLLAGGAQAITSNAGRLEPNSLYPYRTAAFNQFVDDSYGDASGSRKFYTWLDHSYGFGHFRFKDKKGVSLVSYLRFKYKQLASLKSPDPRASKERDFAADLFRLVKTTLPKFSLDDGFEFKNAVEHGQRQCFLQSVLIAGLLQKGGVRAGVAMVNCNIQGDETNNKHAVALARLANGHDLIVDASEDEPFAEQHGLFVDTNHGYRFVKPVYLPDKSILAYRTYEEPSVISISDLRPLPRSFIRSQFDYYRGERTQGGVMVKNKTDLGLAQAAKYLTKSVQEEPQNPLAQYMLGRVYLYRGQKQPAAVILDRAMNLYSRAGWIPPDEKTALGQAKSALN